MYIELGDRQVETSDERRLWAYLFARGVNPKTRELDAMKAMLEIVQPLSGGVLTEAFYLPYKASLMRYLSATTEQVVSFIRDQENEIYSEQDVDYYGGTAQYEP
jgi:hypothetical protein